MGLAAERAVAKGAETLVSSSGGNAGYAVAWAGRSLGVPVTVVVPETTGARMRGLIESTGAHVLVAGTVWDEAHARAKEIASETNGALLHPFDHPDIWEGHASMMKEIADAGIQPSTVVVAVGGGGLLCGVLQGIEAQGWGPTPVVAVETLGAASFDAAMKAGKPTRIPRITSVAVTLGAKRVCDQVVEQSRHHPVHNVTVTDAAAIQACANFLDDHRVLVEPSCGAALSAVYDAHPTVRGVQGPVVVIVCGGAAVTHEQLQHWRQAHTD